MAWDPITRIVGSLGIYTKIDFSQKKVVECHSTSSIFRGYSIFMKGKDPRDAHFITSRICGICGDNHATCSVYNQNMAYGVRPPHLGEWIINLGEAAEYMFDHNIFQENLVGVDYCEKMIAETNPGVLEQANRTEAPHAAEHGFRTIGDIMRALNPFTGEFYREALQVSRYTPRDVLPDGGAPRAPVHALPGRRRHGGHDPALHRLLHPAHALRGVHEALPADARRPVGLHVRGPARLRGGRTAPRAAGLLGRVQRPGPLRLPVPHDDGLGPQDVRDPGRGGRRQARDQRPRRDQPGPADPARALVLPRLGRPGDVRPHGSVGQQGRPPPPVEPAHDPRAAEARLRRQVLVDDVAALVRRQGPPGARHRRRPAGPPVGHGAGRLVDIGFVKATGSSVQINLPRTILKPEASYEWKCPVDKKGAPLSNAIERNRARTYFQAYAAGCALHFIEKALAEVRAGNSKTWEKFTVPDEAISVGFTEAVRGVLSHHMVIRGGKIANYHPYPPTPWNGSVRDSFGTPGPYEDAVQNTPIFEESRNENFKGIDIMRAVRSFDPCLPCGVHIYKGDGKPLHMITSPGMLNTV
jgi:hydrogenase large subunit